MDRVRVGLRVQSLEQDPMPERGFCFVLSFFLWRLAADGDCPAMCWMDCLPARPVRTMQRATPGSVASFPEAALRTGRSSY